MRTCVVLIRCLCCGAEAPTPVPLTPSDLVGDLGRRETIVIEGNNTFTTAQILDALAWHIDFHLAAHRRAALKDYTTLLASKITLGYQRNGFPEVSVSAAPDTNARRIVVRISEGPRFRCGKILLSGTPTMTNATILDKIREKLASNPEPGSAALTNSNSLTWTSNSPAAFDRLSQQNLETAVQEALAELNYFEPVISLSLVPDPARKVADLHVKIVDEGIKGAIQEIEISGIHTNTRAAVLDYLKLRVGQPPVAHLVNTISNELRNSGRFLHREVLLNPQPQLGKFKLELDLEELPGASPLDRNLSPREQAMLKFGEWLMNWQTQTEDLVWTVRSSNSSLHAEGVLSPAGFALAVRDAGSNGLPMLSYSFIASEKYLGFYTPWSQKKFVFKPGTGQATAFARIEAMSAGKSKEPFNLTMGAGFSSQSKNGEPLQLDLDLDPAFFVYYANHRDWAYSIKKGVLTATSTNSDDGAISRFQIETATGRLRQLTYSSGAPELITLEMRPEAGAYGRVLRETSTATATHTNLYLANHGFSSWLAFAVNDVIRSPLIDRLLAASVKYSASTLQKTDAPAELKTIRLVLGQASAVLDQQNLSEVFEPLNELIPVSADANEENFQIPVDLSAGNHGSDPRLEVVAAWILSATDRLLARDSWPWVLARETAFTVAGQGNYTGLELQSLATSEAMGPLGCLATASLLGKMDATQARIFAQKGLDRLTTADFSKDYRLLLEDRQIMSRVLANALNLLRVVNDTQLIPLAAYLGSEPVNFLRQLTIRLREANGQPPGIAAWPAFEKHWKTLRHWLELGLNRYLPQIQFLTDPKALYARGRSLLAANSPMQDSDEAAKCFRKAAEQGHAGAQLYLGKLYEKGQGVTQNFTEAMRWYQNALEQNEPHASCRIADLYRDGHGVEKSLDEAAKWYRHEAERNCSGAQCNLARIYEAQQNLPEALSWYRRAAEAGQTSAQIQLSELLSDGFTVPPDYLEACQWLVLATQADTNNRVLQVQLRRVKAKLTPYQREEAQRRADVIAEKLKKQHAAEEP